MAGLRRNTLVIVISAAALTVAACSAYLVWRGRWTPNPKAPKLKIGYSHSPPNTYIEDGIPKGYIVDIFSEAAARLKIPVEWVYLPEGPDKALGPGHADLWTQVGELP